MTAPVFVDSNVLLYALDNADPSKQRAAQQWRAVLWKSRMGRVSFQVLNEFYVNALRLRPEASDESVNICSTVPMTASRRAVATSTSSRVRPRRRRHPEF